MIRIIIIEFLLIYQIKNGEVGNCFLGIGSVV
jgi:hypothetical protein